MKVAFHSNANFKEIFPKNLFLNLKNQERKMSFDSFNCCPLSIQGKFSKQNRQLHTDGILSHSRLSLWDIMQSLDKTILFLSPIYIEIVG